VHGTHRPSANLSPEQVAALLGGEDVDLIDVRESYEREAGYIPGSRHVELGRLGEAADTLEEGRKIVFVCRVGGRSAFATQAFRQAGYDAYNLDGGIVAWAQQGLPLEPEGAYVADH
jgi:rhodanese-related sulfurtransferase